MQFSFPTYVWRAFRISINHSQHFWLHCITFPISEHLDFSHVCNYKQYCMFLYICLSLYLISIGGINRSEFAQRVCLENVKDKTSLISKIHVNYTSTNNVNAGFFMPQPVLQRVSSIMLFAKLIEENDQIILTSEGLSSTVFIGNLYFFFFPVSYLFMFFILFLMGIDLFFCIDSSGLSIYYGY